MERERLSETFGILMAGMLRAEHQAAARHGESGVYRVLPDAARPRTESGLALDASGASPPQAAGGAVAKQAAGGKVPPQD